MSQKLSFAVTGQERIHCASCEQRISNALKRLPGVSQAKASAWRQRIEVTVDPALVSEDQVTARLEQLGYAVTANGAGG